MLARGDEDGARQVAGVVVSLLVLVTAAAALAGVALAPVITAIVAPGFEPGTRALTARLVRVLFPMVGVTIVAAWCLGILNAHRRFFLSYATPAVWNIAQIGTLLALGGVLAGARLALALAFGALGGSLLELALRLPPTLRLAGRVRWNVSLDTPGVRLVLRAWGPVVLGAGVVQISSIVDTQLGSLLGPGAVATLGYAQLLQLLPIALFGVSVAAVALPDLSRDAAAADRDALLRRLADGARRIAFFVIPSAFAFAALGTPIVGTLFQRGNFDPADTRFVAGVLAAYAIGLPGQASVRLFASGFYALGDTRTPVKIAALSVAVAAATGAALMQLLGVEGIALGAVLGAYLNVGLLARALEGRLGGAAAVTDRRSLLTVAVGSLAGAAAGTAAAALLGSQAPWLRCAAGLLTFGVAYQGVTAGFGHPEAHRLFGVLARRLAPRDR
jgi:putative peptidoglycan lipid II flippase